MEKLLLKIKLIVEKGRHQKVSCAEIRSCKLQWQGAGGQSVFSL